MLRIDAHQHFWHYRPEDFPWIEAGMDVLRNDYLPADLAGHLDCWRLHGSVAVQARPLEAETDWLLELAGEDSRILGIVGWTNLAAGDLARRLERWAGATRLVGFREMIQGAADPAALMRDEVFNQGVAMLQQSGYLYEVLIHARDLLEAIRFCGRHDREAVILDHLGKPAIREGALEPWASQLRELARQPHVHAKLSGMVTEAAWSGWTAAQMWPYLETALDAFGPERLMFGSDWPVCRLAGSYDQVASLVEDLTDRLTEAERGAIWGGTAARCYGLEG